MALLASPSEEFLSDTPPSPALTQTSSAHADPLDEFLELDFVTSNAATPPPVPGMIEPLLASAGADGSTSGNRNPNEQVNLAELFRLYFEGNPAAKDADVPFDPMTTIEGYPFASTLPSSVIDPSLVQSQSPQQDIAVPKVEEVDHDVDMYDIAEDQEDDDEDASSPEFVPAPTRSTKKSRAASSSTARKSSARATRANAKSVAALEIPREAEDGEMQLPANLANKLPHIVFPVPDYVDRPNPDEYKKLTSKEKRQLRNKISARNFRHRRKEYIGALEEVIAQRDATIGVLREEVGSLKVENGDLKRDVDLLKSQFEKIMASTNFGGGAPIASASTPSLPIAEPAVATSPTSGSTSASPVTAITSPTASTSSLHAPSQEELLQAATAAARRQRSAIAQPNLRKDVNPSSMAWGPGGIGSMGRDLSVHHTILPDRFGQDLSGKPFLPMTERNMNPLLDRLNPNTVSPYTSHLRSLGSNFGVHDAFMATNPYAMRGTAVEEYRGQLYTKLANNVNVVRESVQNNNNAAANSSATPTPNASALKLAFFTQPPPSSNSSGDRIAPSPLSSVLAGKVPSSPPSTPTTSTSADQVARLASTTLVSKMASAFFDAFAGPPPQRDLDARKVSDVLAGRSRVQVVPATEISDAEALGARFSGMTLATGRSPTEVPPASPTATGQANCISSILFGRKSPSPAS